MIRNLLATLIAMAAAAGLSHAQQTTPPAQPWTQTEQQIRETVGRVRAGRDLSPKAWPGGARVAVGLSFDLDNETGSLRDGRDSPSLLSQGEYGSRAGLPRVLGLLDKHTIPASFFVPAVSAILDRGLDESHRQVRQARSRAARMDPRAQLAARRGDGTRPASEGIRHPDVRSGKKPVGMRTPSWDYSPFTIAIAQELGLLYDSSLMADDRPYEVLFKGQPTGIVELPVEWILDDYPYFWMDRFSTIRPTMTPDEVFSIWKGEFDLAWEERGLFILTMHPHVIGHRGRIAMLDRLITYMKSKPGVWFATHEQIARHVKNAPS